MMRDIVETIVQRGKRLAERARWRLDVRNWWSDRFVAYLGAGLPVTAEPPLDAVAEDFFGDDDAAWPDGGGGGSVGTEPATAGRSRR